MSGHSKSEEPNAKHQSFKPSAEVASKMQPISREAFTSLVKRAANSPAPQSHPTKKQTSAR
jgi:hypothetical protein